MIGFAVGCVAGYFARPYVPMIWAFIVAQWQKVTAKKTG